MTRIQDVIDFHATHPEATTKDCAAALNMHANHVARVAYDHGIAFASSTRGRPRVNAPARKHYKGAGALDGLNRMSVERRGGLARALLDDDPSSRIAPRLPTLKFLEHRLPGEDQP